MKRLKYLLIAFMLIFSILPAYEASAAEQDMIMRVKLKNYLGNQASITLTSDGEFQTTDGKTFIHSGEEVKIKVESGQLVAYKGSDEVGKYDTFSLSPLNSESLLYINNRSYHGSFEFTVEGGKYVRPINSLYIEDYLKGVVPMEMPALWHVDALKSQTIAARTYALRNQSRVIDDTISYQVYGGAEGHVNTDKAIAETTGIVLKYNNSLIDAVFSSSNGGVTELNSNAWGNSKVPYLEMKEDPFDPKTVWSITVDKQQINLLDKDLSKPDEWWTSVKEKDTTIVPNIKTWLKNNGYKNKDIKITDIPILSLADQSSGGRVTKGSIQVKFYVKDVVDEKGALVQQTVEFTDVAASKIRAIVGIDKMKSYLVDESSETSEAILIKGRGYGHGVGLSQYGAQYRAKDGQTYESILAFYYPGTTLVKAYSEVTEDTVAPHITGVSTAADYSKNIVALAYTIDEDSTISVEMKDQEDKIVATPAIEKAVKSGSQKTTWDIKDISDGTYIATITATDRSGNTSIVTRTIAVKKVTPAVNISSVTVKADYSTEKAKIGYKISEKSTVMVTVKNSKGKVIATPIKQKSVKKGSNATSWNFSNSSDGAYTVTITATDSSKKTKTATKTIQIKKTKGKVTASVLNILEKKHASSKRIGTLKKNQPITILAKEKSWYKIKNSNKIGYVPTKYVTATF